MYRYNVNYYSFLLIYLVKNEQLYLCSKTSMLKPIFHQACFSHVGADNTIGLGFQFQIIVSYEMHLHDQIIMKQDPKCTSF